LWLSFRIIRSYAAGVAQWQSRSFPSLRRGFDSLHPLHLSPPMNRYPRCTKWAFFLFLFAGLTILLLSSIIYIVVIFDPNAYKPEIIRLVKEKKERLLRLDGPITLAFFPNPGVEFNRLSLSERNSDDEFATIEKVHVSLEIL